MGWIGSWEEWKEAIKLIPKLILGFAIAALFAVAFAYVVGNLLEYLFF